MKKSNVWWRVRARKTTPESIAYHEAAHAVVALELGWWIGRGGVRIGFWPHVRLRYLGEQNVRTRMCVALAGLLVEERLHRVRWRFEDDVVDALRAIRAGRREEMELFRDDLRSMALALFDDDPPIRFIEARRAVAYWRDEANKLLDEPRIWDAIERVAKALLRRRNLSARAVRKVLGDAFFAGVKRGDGAEVTVSPQPPPRSGLLR